MRCQKAESLLVAAADGELASRQRRALDRHLAGCARCRAEQVSLEGVLAGLGTMAADAPVPAPLEQRVLRSVRLLAAEEAERAADGWWSRLRVVMPALAAAGVVALAIVGVRSDDAGAPAPGIGAPPARVASAPKSVPRPTVVARRAKPPVPSEPPAELAAQPDLFIDLGMLRDLDKLQHFESIATMGDGDAAPDPATEPRRNG